MTDTRNPTSDRRGRIPPGNLPDPRTLAKGIAAVRILIGFTFLSNGLAKLFGWHHIAFGPYVGNLINRPDSRFILDVEVNKNAQHHLPLLGRITNDLVLPHFGLFGWGLTFVEIAAGLLLVVGLAPRLGALLALGPTVFLFFVYLANDRWVPEQPLELVPLIMLVLVASGGVWGLDGRLGRQGRWPL